MTDDLIERLREAAEMPKSMVMTDTAMREAAAEIKYLRALIRTMIEEDPNDLAADGDVTVLDVWRKEASRALERS